MVLQRIIAVLLVVCSFPLSVSAQTKQEVGCGLISWVRTAAAGSSLTPETALPLHDTSIMVNGRLRNVRIPENFRVSVFAAAAGARGLAFSDDGVLYVAARGSNGTVWAFPDHNKDGVPDSTIRVRTGLGNYLHGIGFHQGKLYCSIDSKMMRLEDDNRDRVADRVLDFLTFPGGGGHVTRTFVFDTARKKLFVQVGSESNMSEGEPEERATILSFNLNGTGRSIFARGIRNGAGMDIDPRSGALWVNNNGMDNLSGGHTDRPPESVYIVCEGANYGWPYAWANRMVNAEYNAPTDSYSGPVAEIMAHSAPLGLHFYRGTKLPQEYRGAMFQAYHGSWNRQPPAPPRVTVMWSDPDGQNARVADFMTGFQNPTTYERFGRTVQVIESPDGDLYVSDDAAGVVYRIEYPVTQAPEPRLILKSGSLDGKTFSIGSKITVEWESENTETIDVFARTSTDTAWTLQGSSDTKSFEWTLPYLQPTTVQVKLRDRKTGLESLQLGTFAVAQLGVLTGEDGRIQIQIEGGTRIILSSSQGANVHAEIVDILGRSQGTIFEGRLLDRVEYDLGKAHAAPGVYFLRVTENNQTRTYRLQSK